MIDNENKITNSNRTVSETSVVTLGRFFV